MNILVTGGAGFIGSNFIPFFLKKNDSYHVVNMDNLTYAGNLDNLSDIENHQRYSFVKGDICDRSLVTRLFKEFQFQGVIHFAAETHVDNSIDAPGSFVETNVTGTFNLLEAAKNLWIKAPGKPNSPFQKARFHHISTDEVYGSLGPTGFFTEKTAYAPNSPYSASKAASDFMVRSYHHTYGMNVVTSNCSNNYGPRQHNEKLIPTIIRNAVMNKPIPIYGDGRNIRDWIYVMDHCEGVDRVFHFGRPGETYNIGGDNEKDNISVANTICHILDNVYPKEKGSYRDQITFVKDRPGHDFRYAIDATKIKKELNWETVENFESGLKKTVQWYLTKYKVK